MYKADSIEEKIASGSFGIESSYIIIAALSRNFGVFHVEWGTDENNVPYAEVGLVTPYQMNLHQPTIDWNDIFEADDSDESEKSVYEVLKKHYNESVIPIITTTVTCPEEVSRLYIGGITKIAEDPEEYTVDLHSYTKEPFEMIEILVRCSFDPEKYKDVQFIDDDNGIIEIDAENFIIRYLAKWIKLQPTSSNIINDEIDR